MYCIAWQFNHSVEPSTDFINSQSLQIKKKVCPNLDHDSWCYRFETMKSMLSTSAEDLPSKKLALNRKIKHRIWKSYSSALNLSAHRVLQESSGSLQLAESKRAKLLHSSLNRHFQQLQSTTTVLVMMQDCKFKLSFLTFWKPAPLCFFFSFLWWHWASSPEPCTGVSSGGPESQRLLIKKRNIST